MEPELTTQPHLLPVLDELRNLEPIFHHSEIGAQREEFEDMTVADFWEVGASGRRYSREHVVNELVERYSARHEDVWSADDFQCREIAPDNYLLTYTLIQGTNRVTRRSTIWRRTDDGWKIFYHQGTVVGG
ncbi:MAG: DUF4440 domain-containing protein [Pseudomonadota bacterium]